MLVNLLESTAYVLGSLLFYWSIGAVFMAFERDTIAEQEQEQEIELYNSLGAEDYLAYRELYPR